MPEPRCRILYIAGWGRSGSTILEALLGQAPGAAAVGEVRFVWQRGIVEDRPCGCGQPFGRCEFWSRVLERGFGGRSGIDRRFLAHATGVGRTRHLPLLALPGARELYARAHRGWLVNHERLYHAIREAADCRVVVDSSKYPSYAVLLAGSAALEPSVVHLVRDPRAVAHSWSRLKPDEERGAGVLMHRLGPARTSLYWMGWNLATERLLGGPRYRLLRYEDLIDDPSARVGEILAHAGLDSAVPFLAGRVATLAPCHTVSGNPIRFRTGGVELRPDDEWAQAMRPRDRRLVWSLTAPVRRRWGYGR
jgi:hypothetical protein